MESETLQTTTSDTPDDSEFYSTDLESCNFETDSSAPEISSLLAGLQINDTLSTPLNADVPVSRSSSSDEGGLTPLSGSLSGVSDQSQLGLILRKNYSMETIVMESFAQSDPLQELLSTCQLLNSFEAEEIVKFANSPIGTFLANNWKKILQNKQLFVQVAIPCAYGGRRKYLSIRTDTRARFGEIFPDALCCKENPKKRQLNATLMGMIGHYLIRIGIDNNYEIIGGYKLSASRLRLNMGFIHLWHENFDPCHLTYVKTKILRRLRHKKFWPINYAFIEAVLSLSPKNYR